MWKVVGIFRDLLFLFYVLAVFQLRIALFRSGSESVQYFDAGFRSDQAVHKTFFKTVASSSEKYG
jgi:hypothetical protein